MYLYITTRLNQGYKVGIAEDIEQRQQQYTTLMPNISFHLFVQTGLAEEIEKSFKHKFQDFRVINMTSTKHMKSEVYQVKLKYLMMHFMNCMHMKESAVVLNDNKKCFSKKAYLDNKISFYLSNYYLPFKNYNAKFTHFNIPSRHSSWIKIKIGEADVKAAKFDKNNNIINHEGHLTYYDFNKDDWHNVVRLFFEQKYETSLNKFDAIIESLNINKKKEKLEGIMTPISYLSPFDRAQSRLSELFFKKLINLNVLRNYSEKQLQDRGGWTSPRLRFFGKVYPAKDKFDLEIPERTDKLV